ncbi:MAG: hypothetical protein EHM24_09135 [Acidobacteria bacterium]|nr:MAG: hypothetical protein EHM24_09135 [Acidobacteriota bacterium]
MATKSPARTNDTIEQEKRRQWQLLTAQAMTPEAAVAQITTFLEQAVPAAMATRRIYADAFGTVRVNLEHGFAVGAELTINVHRDGSRRMRNPDSILIEPTDTYEVAIPCTITATVNWSGTTRTLSEATASVHVYQLLISLGAAVEARFAHGVKVTHRETI